MSLSVIILSRPFKQQLTLAKQSKKKASQVIILTSPYATNVYHAPLIYRYSVGVEFYKSSSPSHACVPH